MATTKAQRFNRQRSESQETATPEKPVKDMVFEHPQHGAMSYGELAHMQKSQADAMAPTRPAYVKDKKQVEVEATADMSELATKLIAAKNQKEELAEQLKAVNKEIDELDEKLADLMVAKKCDLFRVPNLGTFFTKTENYPNVVDPDGFIKWLDENGMGPMAPRSVHPSRLRGWVTEWLKDGKALPPSLNNFAKVRVNTRRK